MNFKEGHFSIHGQRINFNDDVFDSSKVGQNQTGSDPLQELAESIPAIAFKESPEETQTTIQKYKGLSPGTIIRNLLHAAKLSSRIMGKISGIEVELTTNGEFHFHPKGYFHSLADEKECEKQITNLIQLDICKPSNAVSASPSMMVSKKNGERRLVVDGRVLNTVLVNQLHPQTSTESITGRLHGTSIFSTLDLRNGYFQVPLKESSWPLSAFLAPHGIFEFKQLPMGLKTSASLFSRAMQDVFGGIPDVYCY